MAWPGKAPPMMSDNLSSVPRPARRKDRTAPTDPHPSIYTQHTPTAQTYAYMHMYRHTYSEAINN